MIELLTIPDRVVIPDPDIQYSQIASAPYAVYHAALGKVNDKLYQISGVNLSNVAVNNVIEYDPTLNRWVNKPPYPHALSVPTAFGYDGHLYVLGGSGTDFLYRLDPNGGDWVQMASMPNIAPGDMVHGIYDGKLYAVGNNRSPGIFVYEFKTNTWVTLPQAVLDDYNTPASVQVGTKLFYLQHMSFKSYDMATDAFEILPNFQLTTFYGGDMFFHQGSFYVVGGWNGTGINKNIYQYNTRTRQWKVYLTNVPYARYTNHIEDINGEYYLIGGSLNGGAGGGSAINYKLTLS